jgi:hypothetical protein
VEIILELNPQGKRRNIQHYNVIAYFINGTVHTTHPMATPILTGEMRPENEIEAWPVDIKRRKDC